MRDEYEYVIEQFRYQIRLLIGLPEASDRYDTYLRSASNVRSEIITELRRNGVPGHTRAKINDALGLFMPDYRHWLYAKDRTCKLCLAPIACIEEATIDHIEPLSLGGKNVGTNKQLSHGRCNVLKGNRQIKSLILKSCH